MADNLHKATIGDNTYYIRRFNPFIAFRMFADLQKELLPSVAELLLAVAKPGDKPEDSENDGRVLADGISRISAQLGGDRMEYWAGRLLDPEYISVSVNGGQEVKLDKTASAMAFQDFTEIPALMFEVLKFNFAEPLRGFLSRIGLDTSRMNTAIKGL